MWLALVTLLIAGLIGLALGRRWRQRRRLEYLADLTAWRELLAEQRRRGRRQRIG